MAVDDFFKAYLMQSGLTVLLSSLQNIQYS
jgi:hypothetical protein